MPEVVHIDCFYCGDPGPHEIIKKEDHAFYTIRIVRCMFSGCREEFEVKD